MKVRRLQRQDKRDQWYDDAYAYENETGQVIFCYNLTWDRVGSLEAIETVLQPGDRFRWLPVEVVAEEEVEAFLEALDEACAIPKPRPIKMVHPMEEG
jgi:hypothetical protein